MNLPETDFPMRGNLPKNEPARLQFWNDIDIYHKVLEKNKDARPFILHDGPPYANGPIHLGHSFNKILKDFVNKTHAQRGYFTPYIPGWDCHGQPIEHMVEVTLGPEKMAKIDQPTLRRLCREWAEKYVNIQREGFKRLGVNADWDHPYLTFTHDYEAGNVEIFKAMYLNGSVYRGRKPIHWCKNCHTALAEAEIEYGDETSPSIFVNFKLDTVPPAFEAAGVTSPVFVLIWTTTPWTLPANAAVCLAPEADYVMVRTADFTTILAYDLLEDVAETAGWEDYELVRDVSGEVVSVKGKELCGTTYTCPIRQDLKGMIIYGNHVTLDSGTGAVHTAPGHGQDDYLVGLEFDLPILMPVDDNGVLTDEAGPFAGLDVDEANPRIIEWLREQGVLVAHVDIVHSYPHCWRCHQPVIFRATDQWFVSMDKNDLRTQALKAINEDVQWVPEWAKNRIGSMVAERPDWCISRQRSWGVPIPVFKCAKCGNTIATAETFDAVIKLFEEKGSDAWFTESPASYLPAGTACEVCGCTDLVPESDILDVWWESGVSHTSVCKKRPGLRFPADLYLEGSDQHRGWFQSSLLTAVGAFGQGAPFKECVTHGWTVDGEGKAMHKSLGNGVDPADVFNENGADILRLWAASADYHADVRCSKEIFKQLSQNYLKFRNTCKFMLDNLVDFDPEKLTKPEEMPKLDRWLLTKLNELIEKAEQSYCDYEFHIITHAVNDFCVTTLSSFYLDIVKDRLYCDGADSLSRRSAQTALYLTLHTLAKLFAPILAFTCDEIWLAMPHTGEDDARNVVLNEMNKPFTAYALTAEEMANWEKLADVRTVVNGVLETARAEKKIGKSLEADVHLTVPAEDAFLANVDGKELADLLIVSQVEVTVGDSVKASAEEAAGTKCPRCWKHSTAANAEGLCPRCAEVMRSFPDLA